MTRIGEHAIGGGGMGRLLDIPASIEVRGSRAAPLDLKAPGQPRHGRSPEALRTVKETYRIVIMSDLNTSRALTQLEAGGNTLVELQRFIGVIKRSRGGIGK